MGNRLNNITDDLNNLDKEIKEYDVIFNDADKKYISWQDIEDSNSVELYKTIVSLRKALFDCNECLKHKANAASSILDGWQTLNETIEKDPGLLEDWNRILITMKLME